MNALSLIFTYYKNPKMLAYQWEIWRLYPAEVEIVLIDDGSPMGLRAEEVIKNLPPLACKFKLFRILTDVAWNQRGGCNIGARHASHRWIMLVDIDHILSVESLNKVLSSSLDIDTAYTLTRIKHFDKSIMHPHKESRLMSRMLYWKIGGFDESYCSQYAVTERDWLTRVRQQKSAELPVDLELVLNDEISDSKSPGLVRKEGRDESFYEDVSEWKRANGIGIQLFRLPWKRVI